jgi:hypothetical protein
MNEENEQIAPSAVSASARLLLGRHELVAQLLDNAKRSDRVFGRGAPSHHDGECFTTISRVVKGTLKVKTIDGAGSAKTDHQLEQQGLDRKRFGVKPDVLGFQESNVISHSEPPAVMGELEHD